MMRVQIPTALLAAVRIISLIHRSAKEQTRHTQGAYALNTYRSMRRNASSTRDKGRARFIRM